VQEKLSKMAKFLDFQDSPASDFRHILKFRRRFAC
jgi:hypothetical protein